MARVRQQRKTDQNRITLLLAALLVTVVVGVAGAYIHLRESRIALDKETLCPVSGPQAVTVVLVDRTDPFSVVQQEAIRVRLDEIRENVPRYAELEFYSVGPIQNELLRPEVVVCNPGSPEEISALVENRRSAERHWREGFRDRLNVVMQEMVAKGGADRSPIMESIQSISLTAFVPAKRKSIPRRLVIVSDMLQHTSEYSQFRSSMKFDQFQRSQAFQKVRADLRDVDVEILYVRRTTQREAQGAGHIEFWQSYIAAMGGRLSRVVAIEG